MLHRGDCLDILPTIAAGSIDAVVTDPPYELGFMGRAWDRTGVAFRPETWAAVLRVLKPGGHLVAFGAPRNYHRLTCAIEDAGFEVRDCLMWIFGTGFPKSESLLKPAYEPIVLARNPGPLLPLNIDGCRIAPAGPGDYNHRGNNLEHTRRGNPYWRMPDRQAKPHAAGRWPANIVHDGSDEVLHAFPWTGPSSGAPRNNRAFKSRSKGRETAHVTYGHSDDGGSAARFFYCAKAGKADRAGSEHPTVKPLALMRWLCRLVTPPGGTVLDPFAGSGTTLQAAREEGFTAIGIEREPEYQADIERRLAAALL